MKVFFATSTDNFEARMPDIMAVKDAIIETGNVLTRDWIGEAKEAYRGLTTLDFSKINKSVSSDLLRSDIVVVEGTNGGLSTGVQISLALQKNKPVFIFYKESAKEILKNKLINFVDDSRISVNYYNTKEDVAKILKNTLAKKFSEKVRFNLVLQNLENGYLDWKSNELGVSKSELIRDLIIRALKSDKGYGNI